VGTHIDHRTVYAAVVRLFAEKRWRRANSGTASPQVWFYEDRPYGYIRGAVALRFAQLGHRVRGLPLTSAETHLRSFRAAPYVRRYLPPGDERKAVEAILRDQFARNRNKSRSTPAWRSKVVTVGQSESAKLIDALTAYESQIADFLGSRPHLRERRRVERYWSIVRRPRSSSNWVRPL
jgi:hypothetical protein